jgi:predicted nucleic acid-binding protein
MLIDTNIFIEMGKKQEESFQCGELLDAIKQDLINEEVYITKFTLNAIQAIISREDPKLVRDILILIHQEKIKALELNLEDYLMILSALEDLKLDFDDATQFVAANKLRTSIVTFDKDFKNTGLKVKTPKQVLKEILS